jgi:LPXTG-site transpeptidase (sortase) family protein
VTGGVFGVLEVPRLQLSVVVFEGSDEDVLGRGAGHLVESASLAETGNVVLAGHRDTFFRPLRNIRVGDTIHVRTVSAERTYVVESTKVVTPRDIGVLDPTREPVLTLVTCYPFRYVGPAPDRFIVRARETTAQPAVSATPLPMPTGPPSQTKATVVLASFRVPASRVPVSRVPAVPTPTPVPLPVPERVAEQASPVEQQHADEVLPVETAESESPHEAAPVTPEKKTAKGFGAVKNLGAVKVFKKIFHRDHRSGS